MALAGCTWSPVDQKAKPALVVYAASSLVEPFTQIKDGFQKAHPGTEVNMVFAGSQVLRFQIEQGAPADIFASANQAHMDSLISKGYIDKGQHFASNGLTLIVPKDNPAGIETFADLANASLIVLGSDNVPVGAYTDRLLDLAELRFGKRFKDRVQGQTVSLENNVRLVRSKVEMGEANAAIVYRTEANSPRLKEVPVPEDFNLDIRYTIGRLIRSSQPGRARKFVEYLFSAKGEQYLSSYNFQVDQ